MALPNMASTVMRFQTRVSLVTINETLVNGRPTQTQTVKKINAVIHPESPENLTQEQRGESLKYVSVYTVSDPLNIDDRIRFNSIDYRIIRPSDWSLYGYYHTVAEQVRE